MRFKNFVVVFVAFLVMAGVGLAQTGSVTGQVFDPGGAVIPNATVTVTSNSTGLSRTTTTTSAGIYSFPALPPETYTVSVDAEGFAPQVNKNVVLNVGGTLPVNFHMVVAGAVATVEVQGVNSTAVETGSAQLSTVIDSKQISNMPLVTRDPYQLVLLSPGTVTATNNDGGFAVNGARDRNNNFMLDGADNNDTSVPGIPGGISTANPDSTQEFRVITNNFDAEYGRNTGAVIDVVTRGGGNQFHGDAYEFGRYSALGARDFFNKKEDGKMDPYVRNLFGASVGGPLWKDHTFFFLNGEVQRFRTTRTTSQTTPTAAFKSGKFTYIDPVEGSQTDVDLTQPNGNNISGFLQDPTMAKLLAAMPVGQADNGDGVSTTYFFPSPDPNNAYTLTGRFDQRLTDKHQLTVRYIYGHSADSDPFHDEILPGLGNTASISTSHNGAVILNSALSASMTNQLRAAYNQANAGFFCTNHEAIDALTGVDGFGNGRDIVIPGFFTFGCSPLGDSNSQARLSSTLLFGDTFSVIKGAHSWKFGGVFRSVKDNSYTNFGSRNTLTFDNFTNFNYPSYNFNGDPDSAGVRPFEDLVWGAQGVVSNTSESQFFTREGVRRAKDLGRYRQHEWAAFAQDTWKVTPKFTAILGIRYAFNGVPYEKDGNLGNFYGDASAPLPAAGYFAFTPVGPGTGKQLYANSWKMIEPRVGFAYDVNGDGKTAIRGGFGIFHDRIFDNLFGNARSNPPFQASLNAYPFTGDSTSPTLTDIGIPGQLTPVPGPTDGDFLTPVLIDPKLKMPTSLSYNIGIQHEIRNGLTVELNYVGNHNTHGLREIDANPPQPGLVQQLLASGVPASSLQQTALYTGGSYDDMNGDPVAFGPAVNNNAFYHPLLQTSVVSGNYNALQASVRGQFGGLTLTGSYTYAHSLDNGSDPIVPGAGGSGLPRNSFDLLSEYGNSDFDVRQRGTAAANYELPIGLHTAHLNSGFLGHVLEGIQISGIQQVQTGLPFDLRGTVDNLHTAVSNRPEMIGNPYPSGRGTIKPKGVVVGPSATAFANAPFGESVSIRRNKFYGPGFVDTDVAFQKTQTLREQVKLVFRAESYNVFNHPNFASPATSSLNISSSTFGLSQSEVGQADGTTGSRQIQGALKVVF